MSLLPGRFYCGTSNIVVPGSKASFPIEYRLQSRLCYYATLFNSLEINSSFYKVPLPRTFERWATEVPDGFRFTVKLWKGITHEKQLAFRLGDVDRFMRAANCLGNKRGCLLVQFPASITNSYRASLQRLLERIEKNNRNNAWKIAIEFRHPGWYTARSFALADRFGASVVLHDMPASANTITNQRAGFVFIRFHGKAGDYRGSYSKRALNGWARQIQERLKGGKDVYAYFNNTIGDAFNNARSLQQLVTKGRDLY